MEFLAYFIDYIQPVCIITILILEVDLKLHRILNPPKSDFELLMLLGVDLDKIRDSIDDSKDELERIIIEQAWKVADRIKKDMKNDKVK
jgi:hypothetical protein